MSSQAKESQVVEVGGRPENPERYQRYKKCLGKGAFKVVYEAFDTEDGNLVAWNQVDRGNLEGQKYDEFCREVLTLEKLDHRNIIKLTDWWESEDKSHVVFITELMTSGDLKKFCKTKKVSLRTMRKWAKQILGALDYLHTHFEQPIVHRDIKCDNIFINGNLGEVKLGDLGLSTMMTQTHAVSVLGTPEFMAPEMYEETYNQSVDIYAFGMCMLEIFTGQYPYEECQNPGQIFMKVSKGQPPKALMQMENVAVKHFIESCLAPAEERPTARILLEHELLIDLNESEAGAGAGAGAKSSSVVGTPTTAGPIDSANGAGGAAAADATSLANNVPPLQEGGATAASAGEGAMGAVGAVMSGDARRASDPSVAALSDAGVRASSSSAAPLPEADAGMATTGPVLAAVAAAAVAATSEAGAAAPLAEGVGKPSNSSADVAAAVPIAIMDTVVQPAAQDSEVNEAIVVINAQIDGKQKKIQFGFNTDEDQPSEVASDLVEELMDNQAKGLVPTTQPHRDQVIEQIKADFTFSIEQAIETAVAGNTLRRPSVTPSQGVVETVQASAAVPASAAGALAPDRPLSAGVATALDWQASPGAGNAVPASAVVPGSSSEATPTDGATAGNPNPYPALGTAGANSDLGGNVVQPEPKTDGGVQAAAQAHGNQAVAEGPSQMNPPATAAERSVEVAGEQAAATQAARMSADDIKQKESQSIHDWFAAEKSRFEREYQEKLAQLEKEHKSKLEDLEQQRIQRLAKVSGSALPSSSVVTNNQVHTPHPIAQTGAVPASPNGQQPP